MDGTPVSTLRKRIGALPSPARGAQSEPREVFSVVTTGLLPPLQEQDLCDLVRTLLSFLRVSELARVGQTSCFWAPRGSRHPRLSLPPFPSTPMAATKAKEMKNSDEDLWRTPFSGTPKTPAGSPFAELMGTSKQHGLLKSSGCSFGTVCSSPGTEKAVRRCSFACSPGPAQVLTYDGTVAREPSGDSKKSVSCEQESSERPVGELLRLITFRRDYIGEGELDCLCGELGSRLRNRRDRDRGWTDVLPSEVASIAVMLCSEIRARLSLGSTMERILPLLELLEAFCCIGGVARRLEKEKLLTLLRALLPRLHLMETYQLWQLPERDALLRRFNVAVFELLHVAGAEASVDVLLEIWLEDQGLSKSSVLPKCLQKIGQGLLKRKQNPRRQVEAVFGVLHKYASQLPHDTQFIAMLRELAAMAQRASPEGADAWITGPESIWSTEHSTLSLVEAEILKDAFVQEDPIGKQEKGDSEKENMILEELLCVVCLNSKRSVVLRPCNHLVVCSTCADTTATKTCPLCRAVVSERLVVYL